MGFCIGALSGDEAHIQNAQIIVLMALYALLAGYFLLLHPFVRTRTNWTEGFLAVFVFLFLSVCLYTIASDDGEGEKKDGVTAALVALVVLALALRVWFMLHASVGRLAKLGPSTRFAEHFFTHWG